MDLLKKIDSHQHFWDLKRTEFDYSWTNTDTNRAINHSFLPEDLKPHLDSCQVQQCIFVQTQHDVAENRWALELAEQNEWIAGVVGWIDLASEQCEDQLQEFIDHPKFVGVRHVTQDEPDDDFIVRPEVVRGLKVLEKYSLPFDLLFYTKHLQHAASLAKELPKLPLVIDHLSKPSIKTGQLDGWREDLVAAAKFPNVFCKLSGMITEADWENWNPDHLTPYLDVAFENFGAERCMFGSDWPVCELAGSYENVHDAFSGWAERLSEAEKRSVWSETASRFYSLK